MASLDQGIEKHRLEAVAVVVSSLAAALSTPTTVDDEVPFEATIQAVLSMDPRLTAQHLSDLSTIWPSPVERRLLVIRGAHGADSTSTAQWMLRMAQAEESGSFPRAVGKLGAAAAARAFEEAAAGVAGHVALLRGAARQIDASEKLKHVVNHFTIIAKEIDEASGPGLSIEAINRIAQTEIQPGQTVLSFFVETAFTCGEEDLLLFIREMPDLAPAARYSSFNVGVEVEALSVALRRVEYEVEASVEDAARAEQGLLNEEADSRDLLAGSLAYSESAVVPELPPLATFLHAEENVVLSGPILKKGPSVLSKFRPRLLVLTGRRLLYFSSKPSDKTGVIVLTGDSVAGTTHSGLRFELSAQAGEKQQGLRRFYFEAGDTLPNAQTWCEAITDAVREINRTSYTPFGVEKKRVGTKRTSLLEMVPPLPPLESFLKVLETHVLSGPVAKRGPSQLSPFRPRLLILTNRRLLYLSSNESDKKGRIVLTPDSVAGVTHRGKRFEVSAYPENGREMRRYFFEVTEETQPSAQMWSDAITKAINALWNPGGGSEAAAEGAPLSLGANAGGDGELNGAAVGVERSVTMKSNLSFEQHLGKFHEYLERFLSATQPAQAILEADKSLMLAACDGLTARFAAAADTRAAAGASAAETGSQSTKTNLLSSLSSSSSQSVLVGLCKFAGLLARARTKWEKDHGIVRDGESGGLDDNEDEEEEEDEDDGNPLIDRLAHYIKIGVTFEQLERDLTVKGVDDASRLLQIAGARAQFTLPEDLEDSTLIRLGIDPEQAALWSEEPDELEDDESYLYYAQMVSRDVPKEAVAAKLLRDGEDDETIELFSQLYDYRKAFGLPKSMRPSLAEDSEDDDDDNEGGCREEISIAPCVDLNRGASAAEEGAVDEAP